MSVKLRSDVGGASNFNPAMQYTWDIMHVTGSGHVVRPERLCGGHQRVPQPHARRLPRPADGDEESGESTIQLVYEPSDTHTWDGGAGWDDQNWSTAENWVGDSLPSNGDDLVFPQDGQSAVNDDFLTAVGSVDIGMAANVGGSPVTVGPLLYGEGLDDWGSSWGLPTTLRDDTTIGTVPTGNPTGAPFSFYANVCTEDGSGVGHTLTVDTPDSGRVELSGGLTGSGSLVKTGTGPLRLWSSEGIEYTRSGPTDVQAGALSIMSPGALSSHTDVHVGEGAWVVADLWAWGGLVADTWTNTFTGSGNLEVSHGGLTLTGASDSFTGTAICHGAGELTQKGSFPARTQVWGTLRGTGTIGPLELNVDEWSRDAGSVSPGVGDFESGTLSVAGTGVLSGGTSYACDVGDADGAAGTGYDQLAFDGDVTFANASPSPAAVVLRSGAGGAEGPAAGFRRSGSYRWSVLRTAGSITGFSEAAVAVDASAFVAQNPSADGTFSLEVTEHETGQTLDVVYTPTTPSDGPVAGFGNALACGSGYLNAPNSDEVSFSGASEFTVEMWVRPHAGATNNTTLMRQRDGGAGTEETWFAITKDRRLFGGIQSYTYPAWLFFGFDHQLPLDRWSHVAMVKTKSEVELFIDGQMVDSQSYAWPFDQGAPSKAPLTFGGDYLEGNHVPGDLDEITVYDRALSERQLAAVYNRGPGQGLAVGAEDPVRYYRLDETEGAVAEDAGSDGVPATLVDMGDAPWIASTAGRESESRDGAPGVVALAYGSFGAADLSVDVVQQPEHGTVDLTAPGLGQGAYTPSGGWTGTETFTYTVSDGMNTTDPLTAWVTARGPDTHTWDSGGTTALWSDAANWVGDTVPTDGDSLVFPDGTLYDPVNDSHRPHTARCHPRSSGHGRAGERDHAHRRARAHGRG